MFHPRFQTSVNPEPSQITVGNIGSNGQSMSMNQFLGANPNLQYINMKN